MRLDMATLAIDQLREVIGQGCRSWNSQDLELIWPHKAFR